MASFPKLRQSALTADKGVNAVSTVVNDQFNWIFRRVPGEVDFGVDAYFELVTDEGFVTGQSIAAQIKSGLSFFAIETPSAFVFHGERKHLNYYANLPQPVIIILYNPGSQMGYWVPFDLSKTEGTRTGWKISVPKRNVFDINAKSELLKIVGPYEDHTDLLEEQWALNEMISSGSYLHYMVDRSEIILQNVVYLSSFIERICTNETLERSIRGRVLISIGGYDDDERELYEIPEVKRWFLKYTKLDFPWFYLLDTTKIAHWVKLDFVVHARGKRVTNPIDGIIKIDVSPRKATPWLMRNFHRLNRLTERLGLSEEDNKEMSLAILDLMNISDSSDDKA